MAKIIKISNKDQVNNKVKKLGYQLGNYNKDIDKLSKKDINNIINNIEYAPTDIKVKNNNYIVEVEKWGNEIDLYLISKNEYIQKYGNEL